MRTYRKKITAVSVVNYLVTSRTINRYRLFEKASTKDAMMKALRLAAEFSGVRLRACTIMDDHFHAIVCVTRTANPVPSAELLRRIEVFKGEKARLKLEENWEEDAAAGFVAKLKEEQDRLRRRMNDVSQFVKMFKEVFDRWYKKENHYSGTLWISGFKSMIIDDAELQQRINYLISNPVRAGIVKEVSDYRWSWCENNADCEAQNNVGFETQNNVGFETQIESGDDSRGNFKTRW